MEKVGTKEIRTKRLVLRKFRESDLQQTFDNYGSDPHVSKYISYTPCSTLESTRGYIQMNLEQYESNPLFFGWAITLDDVVIGSIALFNVDEDHEQAELGYSIGSKWWKQGYVSEAAEAVVNYGFEEAKIHRIYASHHIDNIGSGKVMEKIGMQPEGIMRDGQKNTDGSYSDLKLYAILKTD